MRVVGSRLPRLGALVLLCAFALAGSASAATAPITWQAATPYAGSTTSEFQLFESIACPTSTECVAVGQDAGSSSGPVVAVEQAGVWGSPVDLSGLTSSPLTAVACSSASSCDAVSGANVVIPIGVSGTTASAGTPLTVALPGGATTGTLALNGIACADSCTAVGDYIPSGGGTSEAVTAIAGSAGSWTSTVVMAPTAAAGGAELTAISCPSSGSCEAVGSYLNASADVGSWTVQVAAGVAGTAEPVTMPVDSKPSPYQAGFAPGMSGNGLTAVSCPSAGVCTAAGNYINTTNNVSPVAIPISGGVPGTAVELATPDSTLSGPPTPGDYLSGISCSDAGDCVVAASEVELSPTTPYVAATGYEAGGNWSTLTSLDTSGVGAGETLVSALACSAPDECVLGGLVLPLSGPYPIAFFASSVASLTVATSSLPTATVGVPYSAKLEGSGGSGSYSWSIGPGALPAGLTLNAATGVISGTPTASGQTGFIVNAADTADAAVPNGSAGLSITVNPAATTAAAPPPTPTPSVRIAYLNTSGNRLVLVLSCSGAACKGKLALTAVEHLKGKTVTAVAASARHRSKKHRTKKITLARGSYSLQVGHTQVRTLKLSKSTVRLLQRLHRIHAELTVTPTGAKKPALIRKPTFKA